MAIDLPPSSRKSSYGAFALASGPSSPTFTEDLTRFPSESLHSFSFAHQSEDFMHNRQNVLKRSIAFMNDRNGLGWPGAQNVAIASAQARLTGDQEMQSMLELLAKAKLVGGDSTPHGLGLIPGPMTGPAQTDAENVFEKSFPVRSESPENMEDLALSPMQSRIAQPLQNGGTLERPGLSPKTSSAEWLQADREDDHDQRIPRTGSPIAQRAGLKRTFTDTTSLSMQSKLVEAMAQPYVVSDASYNDMLSPTLTKFPSAASLPGHHQIGSVVHGHSSRWVPAAQAIFTTEVKSPWTILAANDLACLVFGVTKAEVRKMGILEVVREERRAWLTSKLTHPEDETSRSTSPAERSQSQQTSPKSTTSFLLGSGGVTAKLLSKPSSRSQPPRRAQTDDGAGSSIVAARRKGSKAEPNHPGNKSRGVLLCGDVVPIQKRNGAIGAASLWVKEKKQSLIWVLEEIHEDSAVISLDDDGKIVKVDGSIAAIYGEEPTLEGLDISKLLPRLPRQGSDSRSGDIDWAELAKKKYFTCRNISRVNIPAVTEKMPNGRLLRLSSFPHIAGIICLSSTSLEVTSSNSVFSAALFGQPDPDGMHVTELIPGFDRILKILQDEDGVELIDGMVVPEHSFRRARAFLTIKDGITDLTSSFLRPDGLPAKHRDGQDIKIDVQMRVVKSDRQQGKYEDHAILEEDEHAAEGEESQIIYALWITYSRQLHSASQDVGVASPMLSGYQTPMHQPSPGQRDVPVPVDMDSDDSKSEKSLSHASILTEQLKLAAKKTAELFTGSASGKKDHEHIEQNPTPAVGVPEVLEPAAKKTIDDFVILEEMGQGAYGQVKLARYKRGGNKVVLKYVTKRRILVDTWTRDRRLGTVPLEIHVLDYLRRDGFKHPNIVEMADFFEDDVNYYIEMVPHGLPGMDLFDYIELRVNMEEAECRSIFLQVAKAVFHLHIKAKVVHRDIKDENVVLDGEGNIKLIDFGSAAYIKNGPFDVFVGTIGKRTLFDNEDCDKS